MDNRSHRGRTQRQLAFLAGIKPGDGFSLVTFDSTAHVVVPATHMEGSTDLNAIRSAIGAIRAQGTTAMTEGLTAAIQQVHALYDPARVNRVVLVSDGVPNDPSQLRVLARQAQTSGISISAMGLGLDYDELVMGDLAQTGGGRFKYIDDSSKIASYLGDELVRIDQPRVRAKRIARDHAGAGNYGRERDWAPAVTGGGRCCRGVPRRREPWIASRRLLQASRTRPSRWRQRGARRRHVSLHRLRRDLPRGHFYFGAHASADDELVTKSRDEVVERGARSAASGRRD